MGWKPDHKRMKPKAGAPPTAAEKRHLERVAKLPCCVCKAPPPSTVHHVTSDGFKRIKRSHMRVIPLCPRHHQIQHGPYEGVEALGHGKFAEAYGFCPLGRAEVLAEESRRL